jgi:hypothetical protein
VGPTNGLAAGSKSIQVNLFQNQTYEPRLSEAVGFAMRRELQQDGTYRLDTRGEADIVVNGTIIKYDRAGISYNPNDIETVRDYYITLTARVIAVDRASGATLIDRPVSGKTTVRFTGDLPSAERQAAPLLAEDLARNVTSLLVDGTW